MTAVHSGARLGEAPAESARAQIWGSAGPALLSASVFTTRTHVGPRRSSIAEVRRRGELVGAGREVRGSSEPPRERDERSVEVVAIGVADPNREEGASDESISTGEERPDRRRPA